VSVGILDHSHLIEPYSYHSYSGFDLPHMGNPIRRLSLARVALFLSITKCVSFEYEYA
jgi:hypothetical protein